MIVNESLTFNSSIDIGGVNNSNSNFRQFTNHIFYVLRKEVGNTEAIGMMEWSEEELMALYAQGKTGEEAIEILKQAENTHYDFLAKDDFRFDSRLVPENLSPGGALYGFGGWLTTRDEPVTMSGKHNAATVVELIDKFMKKQGIEDPKEHWEDDLVPMKEDSVFRPKDLHDVFMDKEYGHDNVREFIMDVFKLVNINQKFFNPLSPSEFVAEEPIAKELAKGLANKENPYAVALRIRAYMKSTGLDIKESVNTIFKGKSREELIPAYKAKLKEILNDYQHLKSAAMSRHLDPIDFPREVKSHLRRMSKEISELRFKIDPEKEISKFNKADTRRDEKRKSNDSIIRKIKKETIEKYPDIKEAANIFRVYQYDRKNGQKLLDASRFENISRVKEYVLTARDFMKGLKSKSKAVGHLPF